MGDKASSDYEQDLSIDKYSLDAECIDQPRRYAKWAEMLADAVAERERADQSVDVTMAEVELDIRDNPQKYGLEKYTEATIKALVTADERVTKAKGHLIQRKHAVGILMAAKDAMEQRRAMLENLVKLFLSGYWSDPKIPKDKEITEKSGTDLQKEALKKKQLGKAKT